MSPSTPASSLLSPSCVDIICTYLREEKRHSIRNETNVQLQIGLRALKKINEVQLGMQGDGIRGGMKAVTCAEP